MGTDVTLWTGRALERQHVRERQSVYRRADLAEAEISCIGRVTNGAICVALETNMVRAQAERIAPDGAEHYALLTTVGVTEMAQVVTRVRRAW